jgi:hypothetical protein
MGIAFISSLILKIDLVLREETIKSPFQFLLKFDLNPTEVSWEGAMDGSQTHVGF